MCTIVLQRPFRGEAPVLVEIFTHLFSGVDPQQLLDAPALLAAQRAQQLKEQEARAASAAAKRAHQQRAAQQQQPLRPAVGPPGGQPGAAGSTRRGVAAARAAVANTSHLAHLPTLPGGLGPAPAGARALVPRHVAQAAPSRHAHSGELPSRIPCCVAGLGRDARIQVLPALQAGCACVRTQS